MEHWVPLLDYPGYSVSNQGRIRNDKRDTVLTLVTREYGRTIVGLNKDGMQVKRSVSKLVAETFLRPPKNPNFNTAIHFDGNFSNCRADNMDWRPRWFAMRHAIQFRGGIRSYGAPVVEVETEEVFNNAWGPVLKYGLLYNEVLDAIQYKTYVWPTMQFFEWFTEVDISAQELHGL